jgi:hypothetical protein
VQPGPEFNDRLDRTVQTGWNGFTLLKFHSRLSRCLSWFMNINNYRCFMNIMNINIPLIITLGL